jgi:hypothetical protein
MQIQAVRYKWIDGPPGSTYDGIGYYVSLSNGFAFRYTIAKRGDKQVFRAKPDEKFDVYDQKNILKMVLNEKIMRDIFMTLFTQLDDFDEQL